MGIAFQIQKEALGGQALYPPRPGEELCGGVQLRAAGRALLFCPPRLHLHLSSLI